MVESSFHAQCIPHEVARRSRATSPLIRGSLIASCLIAALVGGVGGRVTGQVEAPPKLDAKVRAQAGDNAVQIERALQEVPESQRAAMDFLVRGMPSRDLQTMTAEILLENVRLAVEARERAKWEISDELFFNDVLPYAVASEARDPWRADFVKRFGERVADCASSGEAALVLNQEVFDEINVHYNTGRKRPDQSPAESIAQGRATCTGLSIILIDACRAVGVPARMTGVASWSDDRGNHTWVEIWDSATGAWHFLGADEPSPEGLDQGWFVADAKRATKGSRKYAVWSTSWQATGETFPLVFAPGINDVPAVDVTDRYTTANKEDAKTCRLFVRLLDRDSQQRFVGKVGLAEKGAVISAVGSTRGERADLNDYLTFELPIGSEFELGYWDGQQLARHALTVPDEATHRITLTGSSAAPDPAAASQAWFDAAPHDRPLIPLAELDQLVQEDEMAARQITWNAFLKSPPDPASPFKRQRVVAGDVSSPYTVKEVGTRPESGWPLVIAMHGGGGTTQEVNDSQWEHMQIYYRDHPEVSGYKYLALRAPNNEWNGFYADYVYPLIDQLLRDFVRYGDIDRDRVYLIGYSHGGYGAFSIGPKMPDRFAAIHASAAAPTEGQSTPKTLRSTRFTHMIGENDEAYGRNWRNQEFAKEVKALKGDRDDIYPVELLWKEGFGHGGLPDRDYLVEMLPHVRNPVPAEVFWAETDAVVRRHFWLVDEQPQAGREIRATCRDNVLTLESDTIDEIVVLLDSRLVDFTRPLVVTMGTNQVELQLQPSAEVLLETIAADADVGRAATCRLRCDLSSGTATLVRPGDDDVDS